MSKMFRIDLTSEIEWQQLRAILEEQGIPHYARSFHDSAYDGLFQLQLGWGYVEIPAGYREEVETIVQGLRDRGSPLPDGTGPERN